MYTPNEHRYEKMVYNRCGKSGLKLPAVSLGIWQNFGYKDSFDNMEEMVHTAFDLGITHIDAANNYGNPYNGSAEENLGKILDRGMRQFRDELVISTKAGYEMWDGPYGDRNGSRKYLTASLDQSLKRMKLDYVDIFYHHIFDPETGYPAASGLRSVTVIDENSTRADALTTALFVMGADKGRAYCEKNGIAAVFITSDRQVFTTEKVSELCSFSFTGEDKGYTYAQ